MGFVYEALKYFREYLMFKHASCAGKLESQNLLNPSNTAATTSSTRENTHPGNCGASLSSNKFDFQVTGNWIE